MEKEKEDLWDTVIEYLPLIGKMAHIYSDKNRGYHFCEYEDLYQEACMVVYDKISNYDPSRGMCLESYLISQIKYHFFDLLNSNKFVVHVPLNYCRAAYKISKIQEKSKKETGEYLSLAELKEKVGFGLDTIKRLEQANRTLYRSMTTSLSVLYEVFIEDMIEDENDVDKEMEVRKSKFEESMIGEVDMEDDLIFSSLREDMYEKLASLTEKQRESILYHSGFITGKVEFFSSIAQRVGGTKQNAHQNYCTGIKKLRKNMLEDWD